MCTKSHHFFFASYITDTGRHGVHLFSGLIEFFILLFADDVALLAITPCGLQNQLDSLKVCCDRLKMEVNRHKIRLWYTEKAVSYKNTKNGIMMTLKRK